MNRKRQELNRRAFLGRLAMAGGALVLPCGGLLSCKKTAPEPKNRERTPHYFIFYFMIGGWDLTLLTEPYERGSKLADVDYDKSEIFEVGGHAYGPAMSYVRPWMNQMSIIRGLRMTALNHPQARFLLHTGRFKQPNEGFAPSVQTHIANKYGSKYPLPSISANGLRPAAFRGGMDPLYHPLRVRGIAELHELTEMRGDVADYRGDVSKAIAASNSLTAKRYADVELVNDFEAHSEIARKIGASDMRARSEVAADGATNLSSSELKAKSRWGRQANMAVEVVKNDLAPVVTVGSGEFDAHTRGLYRGHAKAVKRGMQTVALILEGLQDHKLENGKTLLDCTTVVVGSEFSRTPKINELGGKHHWATNTMLLIGELAKRNNAGIPTVFGGTTETMHSLRINPANGSLEDDADYLDITNAHATLLQLAGIDHSELYDGAEPIADLL